MGDTTNRLDHFDLADPARFKVQSIEPDPSSSKTLFFKGLELRSELLCKVHLYALLKNKVEAFLKRGTEKKVFDKELKGIAIKLKELLINLSVDNLSQNYRFAESFSTNWHLLVRTLQGLEPTVGGSLKQGKLGMFIEEVNRYPGDTPFTLGYYLSEFTGEKWLPFPFMDILYALHEDAVIKKEDSLLKKWVGYLESI